VNQDEEAARVVAFWLDKADAALASARAERLAGWIDFSINRAYYAAFYAASAALLHRGRSFNRHSGVRAAIHRDLVKSGRIHAEWGRAFDRLFEGRQRADYLAFGEFEPPEAEKLIMDAEGFVGAMHTLVGR
jgi:uncharacterized protein